jgi:hypothetical protein
MNLINFLFSITLEFFNILFEISSQFEIIEIHILNDLEEVF